MPIRSFDEWASSRALSLPLSVLKGAVLGIDASHYIYQHLHDHSTREPLLIALGGFPFALKNHIEQELQIFKNLGLTCVFVFNGLDFGKREYRLYPPPELIRAFEQAWDLYDQQQADQVVDAFSSAGSPRPETLYRFLQRILFNNGIEYMVAPYSAAAQLSYLAQSPDPVVDAVLGPSELLLFDIDKLITRIDTEPSQFLWITKQACQDELGKLNNDQFLNFCLLLGSSFLRTFPIFENPAFPGKNLNIRDALAMFNNAGRNALALCAQFEEDRRLQEIGFADLYKRAYVTVKHHVIMDVDGKVRPFDFENAPSDLHELIGQRLPEELYYYFSKGILGSNIPNYLTSGDVMISLPVGGEDTDIYRHLVGDVLVPVRTQSICLLSNYLHRFYQTKAIKVRTWFDENIDRTINLKTLPSVKEIVQTLRVRNDQWPEEVRELQANPGTFQFAVQALKSPEFVSQSFDSKDVPPLSSYDDLLANVIWRFLKLRGYLDEKHQLTTWGICLERALSVLESEDELQEPTFIAIEMYRAGLLNAKHWFDHVSGGPMRGSDEDKNFNILVSRVACIAKLQHKNIGYSGPLSRQLLCYRTLISEYRSALRDLIEVILTGLLLGGDAERDWKDWAKMSVNLPFIDDNDCGLGIAVRTYLDDLPLQNDPTSPEARADVKSKGKDWFQHSDSFTGNLDKAFRLWDAVYKGTKNAAKERKDTKLWDDANSWLAKRR